MVGNLWQIVSYNTEKMVCEKGLQTLCMPSVCQNNFVCNSFKAVHSNLWVSSYNLTCQSYPQPYLSTAEDVEIISPMKPHIHNCMASDTYG